MNNSIQINYTNGKGEVTTLRADDDGNVFLSHSKLEKEIKLGMRTKLVEGLKKAISEIKFSEDEMTIVSQMIESICKLSMLNFRTGKGV